MGQELAYYEVKNLIAIVTIDHPPMNALDVATKEAIGKQEEAPTLGRGSSP